MPRTVRSIGNVCVILTSKPYTFPVERFWYIFFQQMFFNFFVFYFKFYFCFSSTLYNLYQHSTF